MSSAENCGCCEGIERATPVVRANAPGLPSVSFRAGTQPQFAQSMHAAIAGQPALARLTSRSTDDPTIALIDAWAVALDVLAFYDERIANEAFLGTALERRSLLELARAIGYELRPGVAASTLLALTLEDTAGAPDKIVFKPGLRVQSVPGPDEKAQTFETVEPIEAHRSWNALPALATESALPHLNATRVFVKGTATALKPGDAILIVGKERKDDQNNDNWDLRFVHQATAHPPANPSPDPLAGYTEIVLDRPLGIYRPYMRPPHYVGPAADEPRVFALRVRAAAFGHNAPDWKVLADSVKASYLGLDPKVDPSADELLEWPQFVLHAPVFPQPPRQRVGVRPRFTKLVLSGDEIDLDNAYSGLIKGSWLALKVPDYTELYEILDVRELSRSQFGVSAKVSRVRLKGEDASWRRFDGRVREAAVYAQSELLELTERPRRDPVEGDAIDLVQTVDDLPPGRLLYVCGNDFASGVQRREVVALKAVEAGPAGSRLRLGARLRFRYASETVVVSANVVLATHGETRSDEHLGSGDGTSAFQQFDLKQKPLTYVSAANAMGGQTTLEVRVDGIEWDEIPSLYGAAPGQKVFTTRRADDGTVTVVFGNGRSGARLPTGLENVRATYRTGTGVAGNVPADRLTTLLTRPLGLREANNPFAATGGQDPEIRDQARRRAPLTVLTLDRIVSLSDFEDFAAAFLGVGKAQAIWLWNGERRLVHLTVAGVDGAAIPTDSKLYANLRAGIDGARSPEQSVHVDPHVEAWFDIDAKLYIDGPFEPDVVTTAAAAALKAAFAFDSRAFAQGVSGSEAIAIMQAVPGVAYIDLNRLTRHGHSTSAAGPNARLIATPAHWRAGAIVAAELLLLHPSGVHLVAARA